MISVTDGDDAEESLTVNWVSNGGILGDECGSTGNIGEIGDIGDGR